METHPREGVVKEKKVQNTREPSHQQVCGEFWNLRGQHNWEGKKKQKTTTTTTQNTHPTVSEEVAQRLESATSEQGLNMEVQVACLG